MVLLCSMMADRRMRGTRGCAVPEAPDPMVLPCSVVGDRRTRGFVVPVGPDPTELAVGPRKQRRGARKHEKRITTPFGGKTLLLTLGMEVGSCTGLSPVDRLERVGQEYHVLPRDHRAQRSGQTPWTRLPRYPEAITSSPASYRRHKEHPWHILHPQLPGDGLFGETLPYSSNWWVSQRNQDLNVEARILGSA